MPRCGACKPDCHYTQSKDLGAVDKRSDPCPSTLSIWTTTVPVPWPSFLERDTGQGKGDGKMGSHQGETSGGCLCRERTAGPALVGSEAELGRSPFLPEG